MGGVGDDLDSHVVGVGLVALEVGGGHDEVAGAEEQQGGGAQAAVVEAAGEHRDELPGEEVAVGVLGGPDPVGVAQALGVDLDIGVAPGLRGEAVLGEEKAHQVLARKQVAVEAGGRDRPLVEGPGQPRQARRLEAHPRVDDVAGQVAAHPLRVVGGQQEADETAPVVTGQMRALDAQRVEQGGEVVCHRLLAVAVAGRVAPAEAAQVGDDHPVAGGGEPGDHPAPLVEVLRPAVDEHRRFACRIARFGVVHPQAAGVDPVVGDAGELGGR